MPDDVRTVDVSIPVAPEVAEALDAPGRRMLAGQIVSRMFQPASASDLVALMGTISAEAINLGLTEELLNAELDDHKRARRALPEA